MSCKVLILVLKFDCTPLHIARTSSEKEFVPQTVASSQICELCCYRN